MGREKVSLMSPFQRLSKNGSWGERAVLFREVSSVQGCLYMGLTVYTGFTWNGMQTTLVASAGVEPKLEGACHTQSHTAIEDHTH